MPWNRELLQRLFDDY
jgi:hypothetical protein